MFCSRNLLAYIAKEFEVFRFIWLKRKKFEVRNNFPHELAYISCFILIAMITRWEAYAPTAEKLLNFFQQLEAALVLPDRETRSNFYSRLQFCTKIEGYTEASFTIYKTGNVWSKIHMFLLVEIRAGVLPLSDREEPLLSHQSLRGHSDSIRKTSHGITIIHQLADVRLHRYKPDYLYHVTTIFRQFWSFTWQGISLIAPFCDVPYLHPSPFDGARRMVSEGFCPCGRSSLLITLVKSFPAYSHVFFWGPVLHYWRMKQLLLSVYTLTTIVPVLPPTNGVQPLMRGTLGRL